VEDERVRRSKETVLATAFDMLTETGFGGFSIDEVSRRSGVAKMTIYRHWPSRESLLLDACTRMAPNSEIPDTGTLHGDIRALADSLAMRMQSKRWSSLLPSIIDAAERDPKVAELHARQHAAVTQAFRAVIERAKKRKELPAASNTTTLVALVMGPLVYRRWFSREKIDERFVLTIVKTALQAIQPTRAGHGS
jgi:AcrR family transcriptional regulator